MTDREKVTHFLSPDVLFQVQIALKPASNLAGELSTILQTPYNRSGHSPYSLNIQQLKPGFHLTKRLGLLRQEVRIACAALNRN